MPAAFASTILPVELALHGWDIAQSSGQTMHISDEVVAHLQTLTEGPVPAGRGRAFGDEVAPAEGARSIDRLAAYAGRTPITA